MNRFPCNVYACGISVLGLEHNQSREKSWCRAAWNYGGNKEEKSKPTALIAEDSSWN